MKKGNISIFISHLGCPNACSFCNQKTISASEKAPSADEAEAVIKEAYEYITDSGRRACTEIAFFGGSFTAVPRDYMTSLLKAACKYTGEGGFGGIRISTRPDRIDEEILTLLKEYGVTAIELGAQSMKDEVLRLNSRGHTSGDVRRAAKLIKSYGFETGLQMMTGLFQSTPDDDLYTGEEIIKLRPDTVRIYPTVVLRGTRLHELYSKGEYVPYPFGRCVEVCARLMRRFHEENIRVIRLGLHAEEGVKENAAAGYYHPAFGEIVRSRIVRDLITENMAEGVNICGTAGSGASVLAGHGRCNRLYFDEFYPGRVVFERNDEIPRGVLRINGKDIAVF